jgi:peptidoglycan/LPS O-acetylase OafA/YrhL
MKKEKLLGIEFFRGLSTYAVVLVHSGDETWGLPITSSAISFRLLFYFAVPFFLAAAFYFMTANPEIGQSSKFWRSRLERLLIPYAIWTLIFLLFRVLVFTLSHQSNRVAQLLQDPILLIFLGGASYHLYFLPLLFAGTSLVLLMPLFNQFKPGKYGFLFLSIVSTFLYALLEITGNSFHLGTNVAFQGWLGSWNLNPQQHPLLRLGLVEVAWIVRCLPYFFGALTLNQLRNTSLLQAGFVPVWAIAALLANTVGKLWLPGAVQEILLAFTLLLCGISSSSYFRGDKIPGWIASLVASVGTYSFAIYLIHPFVMNLIEPALGKLLPELMTFVSILSMLLLSIPSFLISWLVVFCFSQNQLMAKYLFSIPRQNNYKSS